MNIIGIVLIKNEDLYIERILLNVVDFCDEIIVLDNFSTDNTYRLVKTLAQKYPSIKLQQIADAKTSHAIVEPYAGTDTWFFKIDGDEWYDPIGLQKMRGQLLNGEYKNYWRVEGSSLHCTKLDLAHATATGYCSPPSKPVALLYNFSIIRSWKENHMERLHGRNIVFKDGFNETMRLLLFEKFSWEECPFRCLHLCFIKRSSLELNTAATRLTPNEHYPLFSKTINFIRNLKKGRLSLESTYKLDKYKAGEVTTKKIASFIGPDIS